MVVIGRASIRSSADFPTTNWPPQARPVTMPNVAPSAVLLLMRSTRRLLPEPLAEQRVDDLRVRRALRLLHHLPDEEAEHALLAAAVGLDLLRVRCEHRVDRGTELRGVADRRPARVVGRGEARPRARGGRLGQRVAREAR